jgi:hypothetical protein
MARLDKERQQKLEPLRMNTAVEKITALGLKIEKKTSTFLQFEYKGSLITYFVYSGWASGKTIKDGRGLDNLLNQLV